MLLREPRRSVDQHNLRVVLAELQAAREVLERVLSVEDAPAGRQEKLQNAAAELERAIAIAESYLD